MKVAILGANGFLGKSLAHKLVTQGHEVTGFVLEVPKENISGINFVKVNQLFDSKHNRTERFDVAINLAARRSTTSTPYSEEEVREFTLDIPKQFILKTATPGTLVINASTYIQNFQGVVGKTVDTYGAAKQELSQFLNDVSGINTFQTLDLYLFTIYGPGDRKSHLLPTLLGAAQNGTPVDLSPGNQIINLLYIDDAVSNISHALGFRSEKSYEKHYLWDSEYLSVRKLVAVIEEITSEKILANWGGRNYVGHEMMEPWFIPMKQLPGFEVKVSLRNGIHQMWNQLQFPSFLK